MMWAMMIVAAVVWAGFAVRRSIKNSDELAPWMNRESEICDYLEKLEKSGRAYEKSGVDFSSEEAQLFKERELIKERQAELEKDSDSKSDSASTRLGQLDEARLLDERLFEVERNIEDLEWRSMQKTEEYRKAEQELAHTRAKMAELDRKHGRWD